ncbi:MAG TPA: hypothetical protein VGH28_13950 [Polyangiaceae bacterium]|jgi:hypothetical protein
MTVHDISSRIRRRNGAHSTALNFARKRAVRDADRRAVESTGWNGTIEQHVWDLSKPDTDGRAASARELAWLAYVNSAEHRQAEMLRRMEDEDYAAAVARLERRLADEEESK